MILRRIHLESFRCFTLPLDLGPFDERITVLHGPNAIGKSSILTAIERGLFDKPDSRDQEIKSLVPWGAELSPKVAIDFLHQGTEYRIEKRFAGNGQTLLYRFQDSRFEPWKEGQAGVDFVREILGGRAPGRGATKPEHRGLAQVLFASQGNVVQSRDVALAEGANERLRAVVGSVAIDSATRALEAQIVDLRAEYFTGGGAEKRSSPAVTRQRELEESRLACKAADEAWSRIDDLAHSLEEARELVAATEERKRQLEMERDALRPRVRAHAELQSRREKAARELVDAQAQFDGIAERVELIRGLRELVRSQEESIRPLVSQHEAAATVVESVRRAKDGAVLARQSHAEKREGLRDLRRVADQARDFLSASTEIDDLVPRRERHRACQSEVDDLARRIDATRVLSGRRIKALRDALGEERSSREALDALKLRVNVHVVKPTVVDVGTGAVHLEAEEAQEWAFEGAARISLEGLATISVSGPTSDVQRAKERHLAAIEAVGLLADELGSRSPDELEERRARFQQLNSDKAIAEAKRDEQLRAGETPGLLAEKLATATSKRAAALELNPHWQNTPPDAHMLTATAADAEQAFDDEQARLVADEKSRLAELAVAESTATSTRSRLTDAQAVQTETRIRLATVVAVDGLPDEARESLRLDVSRKRQSAQDQVLIVEDALQGFADDPKQQDVRLEQELKTLNEHLPNEKEDLGRRENALDSARRLAPYEALAKCEEMVAVLESAAARSRLEADALNRLGVMFAEERGKMTARLLEPVTALVVPRLMRLAGPRVVSLEFDEHFRPSGVRIRGVTDPVSPDELSFGTRDQLGVLVRLALGEIMAGDERLPAVLDDPLVHTDRGRVRRLLSILEEASERLQLIVLTCRPEDYQGLATAKFIDVSALTQGGQG